MSSRRTSTQSSGPPASRRRSGRRGADTRRKVEEAAAGLFTRDGYTATTMQTIATEAGVHVQTIYLAYGSKPALLAAAASRLVAGQEDPDTHPGERRWAREVAAEPDPLAKLTRYVQQIGDVGPRIAPLVDVLRATAPSEPEVAEFLADMERGRREGPLQLLALGVPSGTWREGLTPDQVADIVFTLASPDTLRALTDRCGWEQPAAEALIVRTLAQALLGEPGREAHR